MFWTLFWIALSWQVLSFVADRRHWKPSTCLMLGWIFGVTWIFVII